MENYCIFLYIYLPRVAGLFRGLHLEADGQWWTDWSCAAADSQFFVGFIFVCTSMCFFKTVCFTAWTLIKCDFGYYLHVGVTWFSCNNSINPFSFRYTRVVRIDNSGGHCFEVGSIRVTNLLPDTNYRVRFRIPWGYYETFPFSWNIMILISISWCSN